jgi:hypothetical protein
MRLIYMYCISNYRNKGSITLNIIATSDNNNADKFDKGNLYSLFVSIRLLTHAHNDKTQLIFGLMTTFIKRDDD